MRPSDNDFSVWNACTKTTGDALLQLALYLQATRASEEEVESPYSFGYQLAGAAPVDLGNGEVKMEAAIIEITLHEFFNTTQAAAVLGKNEKTITRMRRAGRLQGYDIGRETLYLRRDIFALE